MRRVQRSLALSLPLMFAAGLAQAQSPPTIPPPPPADPAPAATASGSLQLRAPEWPTVAPRRTSNVRARLQLLDTTLIPLADRSRAARVPNAIYTLIVGGVVGGVGGYFYQTEPGNAVGPFLMIAGGFEVATGIIQLAWPPARERLTAQYRAMPRRTAAERREAMRFGERAFEDIAADGARRRVLSSLASAGLSLSMLGVAYGPQIFDGEPWPEPPAANYLVVGLVSASVILALVGLFTRSDEERLRDVWRSQVDQLNPPQPAVQ